MRIGLGMSIVGGGYAPSGITYLSDVGGTPTVAYSVRKVVNGYSGSAIRVRESSGDTETDIGFDGENLDEAALLAHCGANDGFVTKWYDQSGSGYDAVQATAGAQPKIVSAGTVLTDNGKPCFDLTGSAPSWMTAGYVHDFDTQDVHVFHTMNSDIGTSGCLFSISGGTNTRYFNTLVPNNNDRLNALIRWENSVTLSILTNPIERRIASLLYDASEFMFSGGFYGEEYTSIDASSAITTSSDSVYLELGRSRAITPFNYYDGKVQEIILYNSDKSSLRTDIEGNINGYYSIYP